MPDYSQLRRRMVEQQLVARSIRDEAVLNAFRRVPRERFVSKQLQSSAYSDVPLPIGERQTISQPYVVALMIQALELEPDSRVLDIGTGSGYAAAILAAIASEVYSVERHRELASSAVERLARLGFENVKVLHGDGTLGWPEHAPYDAILVSAGGPDVPRPLADQLSVGGRLVIPVGHQYTMQVLVRARRGAKGDLTREELGTVRFVPLVGEKGWTGE